MSHDPYLVFEALDTHEHEQVLFCRDASCGLRAIIAIHNTQLGPALGGCRMYPYASEADALTDVLRLSRGMTYKAAVSGLNLGGGKAVVLGDPRRHKNEAMWRALGRFIQALGGRYITAEDSGTTMVDMEIVRNETPHVVGISHALGGSGDPAPMTAWGVYSGMRAAVEEGLGACNLHGVRVAVQGCGAVGRHLVRHLVEAGAKVTVCDLDDVAGQRLVQAHGVTQVAADAIYATPTDIFAPCAMGGILNANTIPQLTCRIVAGSANNQLAHELNDGHRLAERNILFAPDFAINAGGLINVANELEGYDPKRALTHAGQVYDNVRAIFAKARQSGIMTWQAAHALATERMSALAAVRPIYTAHVYSPLRRGMRQHH